jgi:hypothetical protein
MFELDVISEPGATLAPNTPMWLGNLEGFVNYDIALVKPSLLFAEKVTLFSMRTSMQQRANSEGFKYLRMPVRFQMEFVALSARRDRRILNKLGMKASQLGSIDEAREILQLHEQLELDDRQSVDELSDRVHQFIDRYSDQFTEYGYRCFHLWRERWQALHTIELDQAAASGVLAIRGWTDEDEHPARVAFLPEVDFFLRGTDRILSHLSQGRRVPLIDPGSEFILGLDTPKRSRSKSISRNPLPPAIITASFVARLPGLQQATVAEILDLRKELRPYLAPFRAAMVAIADDIAASSPSDTPDLALELDRRWYGEISPALAEMENEVRRSAYLRRLLDVGTTDKASLASAISGVALGVGSLAAGFPVATPAAAAGIAWPFLRAIHEAIERKEATRSNRLYLLYRAKKQLERKQRNNTQRRPTR